MELKEAIQKRHSIRRFADEPVTKQEIEELLWAGNRIPSAGAVRSVRIHFITDKEVKEKLFIAALNQPWIKDAPLLIIVSVDFSRMIGKYGRRGYRYCIMEAGHAGQNISLMAASLGLGCVMVGAFKDAEVKSILKIQDDPFYIIPLGKIKTDAVPAP